MLKRKLAIILVCVMLLSLTVGCTPKDEETKPIATKAAATEEKAATEEETSTEEEDVVADLYSGEKITLQMMVWGSVETYENLNSMLLEQFTEMANKLDIEVVVGGDGDGGVAEKLRLLLASGEKMPDLVRLNYAQFVEFAEADLLYDMNDAVEPYKGDVFDSVLDLLTYEGGIYCLPQEVKPKIWYYRNDVFEESGINVEDVKSIDDYIQAAKTVYDKTGSYIENYLPPENAYDLFMLLTSNGGRLADEDGNFTVTTDPNVKAAFETLKKYNDSGYFAPISEWSADWQAAFASDTLVSQLIGSWMKQHLINWLPEQAGRWSCALWPEEIREGSEAGMGIWLVFKDSDTPELSADVIAKYSFDTEYRKSVFTTNGIIPPLKSAEADDFYYNHEFFGEDLARVNFEALGYLKIYPYTPTHSLQQAIIVQYLNEYVSGNMTIDEALQSAQNDMESQIGNAYN